MTARGAALLAVGAVAVLAAACGPAGPRETSPRNVLLVSLDTTRADRLGCYGHPAQATPNLDALARDATVFTRALSSNPMTAPAHSTMFTGTSPLVHGLHRNNLRLDDGNVTLAERLRERGLRTAAVVGAVVLDSQFGLDQGFDDYLDEFREERHAGTLKYTERRAEEVSDEAIAWLERYGREPFFLFVHYFDPHAPYEPPAPFASRFGTDRYLGEIAYTDHHLGRVFEALRRLGLWESTLIVVTADHGESLGEHGESTHGYFAYNATLHVPLVVRLPGRRAARVDDLVGLVDVVPTVLGALELPIPEGLDGRDLSGQIGGRPATPDRALYFESFEPMTMGCGPIRGVVEGGWKLVATKVPGLYDLREDWHEATNLAARLPERRVRLTERLDALRSAAAVRSHTSSPPGVDDATAARLRALGYVTDAPVLVGTENEAALDDPSACLAAFQGYLAARAAVDAKRLDAARTALEQALAERPQAWSALALLGSISVKQGRLAQAVDQLARYLDGVGGERAPAELAGQRARAMTNLGVALHGLGREAEALPYLRQATELEPGFAEGRNNLGTALMNLGRYQEAAAEFRAALAGDGRMHAARRNLARVLVAAGKVADGVRAYREAFAADPGAGVCNELAWLLATCAEPDVAAPDEAVALAEQCLRLAGGRSAELLDTLAAAYAGTARFAEALSTADEALRLANTAGEAALAREIGARLERYRRGEPYRSRCAPSEPPPAGPQGGGT